MSGSAWRRSGGVRILRWTQQGRGKRGGAGSISCNHLANGETWSLTIYAEADNSKVPASELKLIKETIDDGQDTKDDEWGRRAA